MDDNDPDDQDWVPEMEQNLSTEATADDSAERLGRGEPTSRGDHSSRGRPGQEGGAVPTGNI